MATDPRRTDRDRRRFDRTDEPAGDDVRGSDASPDFEGHIPEQEYGGGDVVVWDLGAYRNDTTDDDGQPVAMVDAVAEGHVRVTLDGHKLHGSWALTQTHMRGDPDNWLLVKVDDDDADARRNPTSAQPASVLSGRTVDDVAAEHRG